jgi:hypothetical protein
VLVDVDSGFGIMTSSPPYHSITFDLAAPTTPEANMEHRRPNRSINKLDIQLVNIDVDGVPWDVNAVTPFDCPNTPLHPDARQRMQHEQHQRIQSSMSEYEQARPRRTQSESSILPQHTRKRGIVHRLPHGIHPDGESGRRGFHPIKFLRICLKSSSKVSAAVNILWPFVPFAVGVVSITSPQILHIESTKPLTN